MREESGIIRTQGAEVYLEDVGALDAPVLVYVHGGPGHNSYGFRESVGEALAGYRVLYLDQRGSGRSPELPMEPSLFTVDALAEDLEQVRVELGIENWLLLAHGFGAIPALEHARRFPGHAMGAILLAPWLNFPWLARRLWQAAAGGRGFASGDMDTAPESSEQCLAEAFADHSPKTLFDQLMFPSEHARMEYEWIEVGGALFAGPGVGEAFAANGLWELDYLPYLEEAALDIWVEVGEQDDTSYPEQTEALVKRVGAELRTVPLAGHYPWIDEPEAFTYQLYEALDSLISVDD